MSSFTVTVIPGNASLASKIREITELRRPVVAVPPPAEEPTILSSIASIATNAINAATALGKRRRAGYESSTHTDVAVEKRISKRVASAPASTSLLTTSRSQDNLEEKEKPKRPISRRTTKETEKITEKNEKPEKEITSRHENIYENENEESGSESKRMRVEINRLQGENEDLLNGQFTRETEIRIEVSLFPT